MKIFRPQISKSLINQFFFRFCSDEIQDIPFEIFKQKPDIFEDFTTLGYDNIYFHNDLKQIPYPVKTIRQNKQLQYLKQKNSHQIEKFYQQIESPNSYSHNIMVEHYLIHDKIDLALKLLGEIMHPNQITFSCFAKYYINKKEIEKSLYFVKQSIVLDPKDTYTFFLIVKYMSSCSKQSNFQLIQELFSFLQEQSIELSLENYFSIVKIYQKNNQVQQIIQFLEYHHNFSAYKAFFLVLSQRENAILSRKILLKMEQKGYKPDRQMYKIIINEYHKSKSYNKIIEIYEQIDEAEKFQQLGNTLNLVLKAYGELNKLQQFENLYYRIENRNIQTYNIALKKFGKLRNYHQIEKIINEMDQKSIKFSHFTYNILSNIYGQQGEYQKIFQLLKQMKIDDLLPENLIYSGLIMALGKHKLYKQIFEVIQEMELQNIQISKQIYGQVIDLFSFYDVGQFHFIVNKFMDAQIPLDENNYISIIEGYFKFGLYQQCHDYHFILKQKFKFQEYENKLDQLMGKINKMKTRVNQQVFA